MNTNKPNKQQRYWIVDLILFTGFIVAFFLDITGLDIHQWLGIGLGALALYHLIAHWGWVKAVTRRFITGTSGQSRLYYLIDTCILAGFAAILGTGLLISSWLNLPLPGYDTWRNIHILSSITTLLALVAKLAFHWKWIVLTTKKIFSGQTSVPVQPVPVTNQAVQQKPAVAAQNPGRREFLAMMGVVSAAALIPLGKSISSLSVQLVSETDQSQTTSSSTSSGDTLVDQGSVSSQSNISSNTTTNSDTSTQTDSSSTDSSTTLVCTRKCNKGRHCSYPGQCRQYTDSNNNGLCDLGECA